MSKDKYIEKEALNQEVEAQEQEQPMEEAPKEATEASLEQQIEELKNQVEALNDIKLRQMAEFDNYRRRTNKEKLDLIETAGEKIFKEMLPLVDDFERAVKAMAETEDIDALRDGIQLIYSKFVSFLEQHEVRAIETEDADFDTDKHEAITTFAAGEEKKGKIIDCTQKGYTLGDKVIRFAKVVVGE